MIRPATVSDHPWIVELGSKVYCQLGDYGSILPGWLEHPGVLPHVDEHQGQRRGFILLGFYTPADAPAGVVAADLLAIAVAPDCQRQGIGRSLLCYAIELARLAAGGAVVPEMRLTVADTNLAGQRLFRSQGFAVLDADHGLYDGGQRAMRMVLPLVSERQRRRARP